MSIFSKALSSAIILCASSTPLLADYDDHCPDPGDVGHFLCVDALYKKFDAQLNAAYNRKRKELLGNKVKLHQFVDSEKKWIRFKERKCHKIVEDEDVIGRTADIVFADCAIEETVARIEQIE